MSRPHKHSKTGVYWFRKRVPTELVDVVGRREVTKSLDTRDPEEAKRRYADVLREYELRWSNLRRGPVDLTEREAHRLAVEFYEKWIAMHRDNPSFELLWHPELYKKLWTAPKLPEEESAPGRPGTRPMENIVIPAMRRFCVTQAEYGLENFGYEITDWNRMVMARAIAAAIQRAHPVLQRLAEGISDPNDLQTTPIPTSARYDQHGPQLTHLTKRKESISLIDLVEAWWKEAQAAGRKPSTYESYRNTFKSFSAFLANKPADSVVRDDVIRFKDHRLNTPSPRTGKVPSLKTVKDSDLSALKAVFDWAVMNDKVGANPATNITIKISKRPKLRGKGFTDDEATALLAAALKHIRGKESPTTSAAKRWVPWLCAFTGARLGEIAQLRKEDVTYRDNHWIIRITPEAGTVKTNQAREVVLHSQVVELGFPDFVNASPAGHLFLKPSKDGNVLGPLQALKNRLGEFARGVVVDRNVAPFHGWRHRFKTVGMEAGIPPRILDAIQGHAPRSVSDGYGDVTIKTIAREIAKLPAFDFNGLYPRRT